MAPPQIAEGRTEAAAHQRGDCTTPTESPSTRAVAGRHGLDGGGILDIAGRYAAQKGVDFNEAPAQDFEGAPLGDNLASMVHSNPAFDAFRVQFDAALESLDCATSDAIIDRCLAAGVVVNNAGKSVYGEWRRSAERLEGLNAALFGAACGAARLNRFIGSLGELDNYRLGRWRREGGAQDRVPATVGSRTAS